MLSIPSTVLLTPHPFRGGQGTLLAAGFPPQPGVQPHFPVPEHPWVVVRKQSGHRPNADPSPKAKTSKKKRYARSNKNVVWGVEDGRETPLLGARSGEVKRSCNHPARRNPYRLFFCKKFFISEWHLSGLSGAKHQGTPACPGGGETPGTLSATPGTISAGRDAVGNIPG